MARKRYRKIPIFDLGCRCVGYEVPEKGIRIIECEKGEADRIICKHHYSHKVTQNSFVSLLVVYQGGGRRCVAMRLRHSSEDKGRVQAGGGEGVRPHVAIGQDAEIQRNHHAFAFPSLYANGSPRGKGAYFVCRHHGGEQWDYLQSSQLCADRQVASGFLPFAFWRACASCVDVAQAWDSCLEFPAKGISRHCSYQERRAVEVCEIPVDMGSGKTATYGKRKMVNCKS